MTFRNTENVVILMKEESKPDFIKILHSTSELCS